VPYSSGSLAGSSQTARRLFRGNRAIATTRQPTGFGMEAIGLVGAESGAPRDLLLLNFAITAASEMFY
jgi:hypothetical protein